MKAYFLLILVLITFLSAKPLKREALLIPVAQKKASVPSKEQIRAILNTRNNSDLFRLSILVNDQFQSISLKNYGFRIISRRGNILFIEGHKKLVSVLRTIRGVLYVQKPNKLILQMDKARIASFVNPVHDSLSQLWDKDIKGEGVIVAILDSEFDTRHPAFLDDNGDTRFIAVWDFYPEDDEGFPSFAYSKERVPYGAALLGDELKTFPYIGLGESTHGTHVASIAAGSITGNGLHGFAPEAYLIGVKVYQDQDFIIDKYGNPFFTKYAAHSGELAHAIEWVFSIADSLNLPCVVNMSIGSSMGPHDGSSLFDQFIDSISGPGRVIVGSAGNSGDKKLHLKFNLTPGDTSGSWGDPLHFDKDAEGNDGRYILMDFWGEIDSKFSIQAVVENKTSEENIKSTFVSSSITGDWEPDTAIWNGDTIIFYLETDSSTAINGKPRILAGIVSSNKDVNLGFRIIGEGIVNGWHSNMYRNFNSNGTDGFIDGDTHNTIIEIGGTSKSIISVGAYTTKGVFENWKGDTLDWLFEDLNEVESGIAYWSSVGPTIDGRQKPDVAAPGKMIAAAHTRIVDGGVTEDLFATWPNYPDTTARYAFLRGTSMSAPMMTGAAALLLQMDPTLDHQKIKEILNATSYSDEYTGTVPNYRWGAGKLNVLKAVESVYNASPIIDMSTNGKTNGYKLFAICQKKLQYVGGNLDIGTNVSLYDLKGRRIFNKTIAQNRESLIIDLNNISSSTFIAIVKYKGNTVAKKKFLFIN